MRKRTTCIVTMAASAVLFAGCGNAIPEMNEQQQELVVEYAADVVLKHSINYDYRLVDLSLVEEAEEEMPAAGEQAKAEQETSKNAETSQENEQAGEVTVQDNTEGETDVSISDHISIADFLKLESVEITYTGYETEDLYPEEGDGEDLFFVMNATQGNQLLILKFQAENKSGTDAALDISKSDVKFRIMVDGARKNALTTMLPNDLAYYQGTLAPGESTELVLVCEVPQDQGEISSLELMMRSVDDTATISLN